MLKKWKNIVKILLNIIYIYEKEFFNYKNYYIGKNDKKDNWLLEILDKYWNFLIWKKKYCKNKNNGYLYNLYKKSFFMEVFLW